MMAFHVPSSAPRFGIQKTDIREGRQLVFQEENLRTLTVYVPLKSVAADAQPTIQDEGNDQYAVPCDVYTVKYNPANSSAQPHQVSHVEKNKLEYFGFRRRDGENPYIQLADRNWLA